MDKAYQTAIDWYERRELRDKKDKPWDVPVRDLLFEDDEELVEED
jgi:hypothetical protein